MISRILLPTDFSDVANNALRFALDLCKKTGAELHVLHVNHVPVADINFPQDTYQIFLTEIIQESQKRLDELAAAELKPSGVKYELVHKTGFVNDEVLSYCGEHHIDLLVMGTTGASGLQEILIGSNTASVVNRSPIPVFVIPPSATHVEFKHILYTSDYSEPEFPAVARLIYFAEQYKAKVTVLHAKTDQDRYFKTSNNFFVRNKSNISYPDITVVNTDNPDITEAINKYIDEQQVDMVVMAKHNRSWFDRLFHRSLSKKMTYHTRVPLLVLNK